MFSLENYRNKQFVAFCTKELEEYTKSFRGINTALIATPDGFEIAAYNIQQKYDADKLAAVGSSVFALGVSLVQEFDLHNCKSIILDSERGKVFISTISDMQHSVIFIVQTDEQAILGNVMHGSKKLSEKIAQKLSLIG